MQQLKDGIRDALRGAALVQIWWALAHDFLKKRFRRSAIGLLWVPLSFALFITVKSIFFGSRPTGDLENFVAFIIVGYYCWTYISGMLLSATSAYVNSVHWIEGVQLPYSVYLYQTAVQEVIFFALSGIVVVVAFILLDVPINPLMWTIIPALGVYVLSGIWTTFLFSSVGLKYRDLTHSMQAFMRVMFFATPILWSPEQFNSEFVKTLCLINPFTHYLAIVREPIISGTIPVLSWQIVCGVTLVGCLLAVFSFSLSRKRLVYWI